MNSIFDYMTVISAVLVSILILIQTRGASLGAGFGSSSEVQSVRRGADKSLHQITIVMVIIFALSLVLGLLQ
jgi:preprotein translocase subunit SecG